MQLLGEDLDLRRITWRLPPETIPRLSGSSRFSSDTEGLLHEEDSDVATGSLRRSGTPRPQAGEGRLHYGTECPVSSCSGPRGRQLGSTPARVPFLPLCAHPRVGVMHCSRAVVCFKTLSWCVCSQECQGNPHLGMDLGAC